MKTRQSNITAAQIRAARGSLTQVQAAEIVGCTERQFQRYEAGTVAMRERDWATLAAASKLADSTAR